MQRGWILHLRASSAGLVCALALAGATGPVCAQSTPPDQSVQPPSQQTPTGDQKKPGGDAKAKADTPTKDKKDAKGSTTVQGVTVTAQQSAIRTDIDRRSYDLTKDLQTQAGASLADALRTLPQVDVDVQGNVTIRGAGVQILVDGQPSGLFRGGSIGDVLQSLPADQYERVEVKTNPSAAFSPDGSGGIINLISKKTHKTGSSGTVRANIGVDGRSTSALTGAWKGDKLTVSAGVNWQYRPQRSATTSRNDTFDASGDLLTASDQTSRSSGLYQNYGANVAADYDLDAQTRLSASAQVFASTSIVRGTGDLTAEDGSGLIDQRLNLIDDFGGSRASGGGAISLRRNFSGDEHDVVVSLSHSRNNADRFSSSNDTSLFSIVPELFNERHNAFVQTFTDLKADYEGPMPGQAKLKAGYDLQIEQDVYDDVGFNQALSPSAPYDPAENDLFRAERRIESGYVTYQQPFGKLTVLAGLRAEDTHIALNQEIQAIRFASDDFQLYPTLHLSWSINDDQSLLAGYSRRVQRPDLQELDPFRIIYDPFSASQGNPALKPEQTQQFEAGYQYKQGPAVYIATAFAKLNSAGVTEVTTILGPNDFLYTDENLTRSREIGFELVASGKVGKDWTYNLSTSGYRQTIDASTLGFVAPRSAFETDGHATLTWQATPKDTIQVNGSLNPRQLDPQGYQDGNAILSLGYRHKVDDHLYLMILAQDLTRGARYDSVIDTPTLKGFDSYHPSFQTLMFGFTYAFGAGAKRDPGFDIGAN